MHSSLHIAHAAHSTGRSPPPPAATRLPVDDETSPVGSRHVARCQAAVADTERLFKRNHQIAQQRHQLGQVRFLQSQNLTLQQGRQQGPQHADTPATRQLADDGLKLASKAQVLEVFLGLQAGEPLPPLDPHELQTSLSLRNRTVEAMQQGLISCQTAPQWETPEGEQKMQEIEEALQPQLRAAAADLPPPDPAVDDSHYDFYEQLMKLLEGLQGDWLDRNQDVLENFIAFFNELNDIMAMVKDAIQDTNGSGEYLVNFGPIASRLQLLMNDASKLGLGGDFPTEADAKKFLEDMGSPEGLTIRPTANGYELAIDRSFIEKLRDSLYLNGNPFDNGGYRKWITPARYQAIIAQKDGLMERMNHISKVMTEKYQRTLQQWDTLVKALSSTIDAMSEADRLFISNMT